MLVLAGLRGSSALLIVAERLPIGDADGLAASDPRFDWVCVSRLGI